MQVFAKLGSYAAMSLLAAGLLAGCSSSNKGSQPQNMLVRVQAGQGDITNAYIRAGIIQNNGLIETETDGRAKVSKVLVTQEGNTNLRVMRTQMHHFNLVGRQAQADRNQEASTARCQWVEGCSTVKFGERLETNYNWQAVTFGLAENEGITITPLTHMAAALAKHSAYDESNKKWWPISFYSPQSIVQANSQLSKLFGLEKINILYQAPADLTRISSLNLSDLPVAKDQIRYGALVAAWLYLEEQDRGFTEAAVSEFVEESSDEGRAQLKEKDSARTLSLDRIYELAISNLDALATTLSGQTQAVVKQVSAELQDDQRVLSDKFTGVQPDILEKFWGADETADFKLGLEQAKEFVAEINKLDSEFFDKDYQTALKAYKTELDNLSNTHKKTFEGMLVSLITNEQKFRSQCSNLAEGCKAIFDGITYELKSHVSGALYMQLNITGSMTKDALTLDIKSKADKDGMLTNKSYLRVYFGKDKLDELLEGGSVTAATPLAYELHWADFTLYDHQEKFAEQTGELDIFYRGVKNPENPEGDNIRFNIEKVLLNSKISDAINDKGEKDKDIATLFIAAQSTNAATYFASQEFAELSFEEFFKETTATRAEENNLVSYAFGKEANLSTPDVEYFDLYIEGGQSTRYRFYPDAVRVDNLDSNNNGDITEKITTHDMSICPLEKVGSEWKVSGTCTPKQRFYERRDVQRTLNTLWKAGAFSYLNVTGSGDYFVEWPVKEVNGCFELETLADDGQLSGKLLAKEVLGLNSLRFTSEILLDKQPKTLFDMKMYKPTKDRVNLTFALSNNYSGLSSDEVVIGSSQNMNRIIFSYNTDSAFSRSGNISFYKGGVSLTNDLGQDEKVDGEFFFGFNQPYASLPHKYIIGPDGDETVCVTSNEAVKRDWGSDKPQFSLAFGGVVYGTVKYDGGWKASFIDGEEVAMTGFDQFLNMTFDFLK